MEIPSSKPKVNCGRQDELDLLKVFPILFMVIIHVYENLAVGYIDPAPRTLTEYILQFLAGPPAAPAFMFAMGAGMVYSSHHEPRTLFIRGLKLFIGGYVLNAARSALFICAGFALTGKQDPELLQYLFLNGDIFHFAGLAFMFSALLKYLRVPLPAYVPIALCMQAIGYSLSAPPEMTGILSYFAGLFWKCTYACCFPLLQWYIFPAAGILYGTVLQYVSDKDTWYRKILLFALLLFVLYAGGLLLCGFDLTRFFSLENDLYYNQYVLSSLFALLIIFIELGVNHLIVRRIRGTQLMNFIVSVSKNLIRIFVLQWIIVGFIFAIQNTFELGLIPLGWIAPAGILLGIIATAAVQLYEARAQKSAA